MTNAEFHSLRDYIYRKTGIFFSEKSRFILDARMKEILEETGAKDVEEYLRQVEDFRTGPSEMNRLINRVTITETSFFRDMYQIAAIEKNVIPEMIRTSEAAGTRQIRIWSAAASSGEEAYTIAILLAERLREAINRWAITIFATDINDNVLDVCKSGVYNSYSLRNTAEPIKKKYFHKVDHDSYAVRDDIRKMVVAEKCNLMDQNACRQYVRSDLILIRNVLIYFDTASKTKVLHMCYDNLRDGGYLFLGHSETIFGIKNSFKLVNFVNAFAYRKLG